MAWNCGNCQRNNTPEESPARGPADPVAATSRSSRNGPGKATTLTSPTRCVFQRSVSRSSSGEGPQRAPKQAPRWPQQVHAPAIVARRRRPASSRGAVVADWPSPVLEKVPLVALAARERRDVCRPAGGAPWRRSTTLPFELGRTKRASLRRSTSGR